MNGRYVFQRRVHSQHLISEPISLALGTADPKVARTRAFSFGSLTDGVMSRPFAEVVAELPPVAPDDRRNPETINRDLSTMATVARHLAATSWKPRLPGTTVMDFSAGRIAIKVDPNIDTRASRTTRI
jgi:hypothetical protein